MGDRLARVVAAAGTVRLFEPAILQKELFCFAMEPNEALAELLDLSSQIEDVAILGASGFVLAGSGTPERCEQLARIAAELVAAAGDVRRSGDVSRIEVALDSSSVFVVSEAGRTAVATTVPEPTAGLVVYDLRTALRRLDEKPVRKPARKKKKDDVELDA